MRRLLLALIVLALTPCAAHAALVVPADVAANNDPGRATAVVNYVAPTMSTLGSLFPPASSAVCSPASGAGFPVGTTTVTCSAQVAVFCIGNDYPVPGCVLGIYLYPIDSGSFRVTVRDVEPPTLNPANLSLATPPGGTSAVGNYVLNTADNVGVTGTSCSLPPGSAFPVGVTAVTCTASDAAGNTSQPKSFTVTVVPTPAPPQSQPAQQGQQPCTVPNLKGKKLAAAKRALNAAHCSTGTISKRRGRKNNKGKVLSQSPKPGKHLAAGSKVNLTVGR